VAYGLLMVGYSEDQWVCKAHLTNLRICPIYFTSVLGRYS